MESNLDDHSHGDSLRPSEASMERTQRLGGCEKIPVGEGSQRATVKSLLEVEIECLLVFAFLL